MNDIEYCVSYRYKGWFGLSGNQNFESKLKAEEYIKENKHKWQSYSLLSVDMKYYSGQIGHIMTPIYSYKEEV